MYAWSWSNFLQIRFCVKSPFGNNSSCFLLCRAVIFVQGWAAFNILLTEMGSDRLTKRKISVLEKQILLPPHRLLYAWTLKTLRLQMYGGFIAIHVRLMWSEERVLYHIILYSTIWLRRSNLENIVWEKGLKKRENKEEQIC